ncbi:MAG TPA: flagellar hook-basal body complex protein FliE [Candidatus Marinimicrobia bacterium]|nr:flagellar hook-basal body complex protein FliE [Candidatus Neomarinimicrobiota bacterium]
MKVSDLLQNSSMQMPLTKKMAPTSGEKVNFADTISGFLQAVNKDKMTSSAKVADVVSGKSENLADAMVAMEESKLSFELMLQVRNKLLESYQELSRMPI